MKRQSRTPVVTVIRRGTPSALTVAAPEPSPRPARLPPRHAALPRPASSPRLAAPSQPATPPAPTTRTAKWLRERLVARAAPHAEGIRRLLDEASAANGGQWPHHVHVTIAETLAVPRSVVHAFLGALRERRSS